MMNDFHDYLDVFFIENIINLYLINSMYVFYNFFKMKTIENTKNNYVNTIYYFICKANPNMDYYG